MLSTRRLVLVALATFTTFQAAITNAAECTDAEVQTSQNIWGWAATTSACAQYAVGDSFVSAPCTALSCVAVMEQVGEQLPDCTVSGVNNKIEVQNAMTVCNGEDLTPTDAPFVSPPTAAPLRTIAPITTSAPFETSAPLSSLAPRPGGSSTGTAATSATSDGSVDSTADSTLRTGSSGSSSASSPAVTSSTTTCTTSQAATIVDKYTTAAKSPLCVSDSTISTYSIYIFTKCASSCATTLKTLANELPNCLDEISVTNVKTSLLDEIDACDGPYHATTISTTAYVSPLSSSDASRLVDTLLYGRVVAVLLALVVVLG